MTPTERAMDGLRRTAAREWLDKYNAGDGVASPLVELPLAPGRRVVCKLSADGSQYTCAVPGSRGATVAVRQFYMEMSAVADGRPTDRIPKE